MITKISIKNVKGFGNPPREFDVEIKDNRVNIIMAPNGFGKTSIAKAFDSLGKRSFSVKREDKFHKDDALESELKIVLNGEELVANQSINQISPKLECSVINSRIAVSTTQYSFAGHTTVSGEIDIEDIVVCKVVPSVSCPFRITEMKSLFGENGKVLPNYQETLKKPEVLAVIEQLGPELDSFLRAKFRKDLVKAVLDDINALEGTAVEIIGALPENQFDSLFSEGKFVEIWDKLSPFFPAGDHFTKFAAFFEVLKYWELYKDEIREQNDRNDYLRKKEGINEYLSVLNPSWRSIQATEKDDNLVVHFPLSDELSNGQRDLLTFVIELLKFKAAIRSGKQYLLMIDEVFDYLDDANIIVVQHYLSDFLKEYKNQLYLCILTHLNPYTFKNYLFAPKRVNHVYLKPAAPKATDEMKAFIAFREGLDRTDSLQDTLYNQLSSNLFHYHPSPVDLQPSIASLSSSIPHLDSRWGEPSYLHNKLVTQLNKYLSDQSDYDPYAVAMCLRLKIEKNLYDSLPVALQNAFLQKWKTIDKIEYCDNNGIEVPEYVMLVNAIHNEADHLKFDYEQVRYVEKPIVYKLQHPVIHHIIETIFEWEGHPLNSGILG